MADSSEATDVIPNRSIYIYLRGGSVGENDRPPVGVCLRDYSQSGPKGQPALGLCAALFLYRGGEGGGVLLV